MAPKMASNREAFRNRRTSSGMCRPFARRPVASPRRSDFGICSSSSRDAKTASVELRTRTFFAAGRTSLRTESPRFMLRRRTKAKAVSAEKPRPLRAKRGNDRGVFKNSRVRAMAAMVRMANTSPTPNPLSKRWRANAVMGARSDANKPANPSRRAASAPAPASLSGPRKRCGFDDETDACGDDDEPGSAPVSAASGEIAAVPLTISASVFGRSATDDLVPDGLVSEGSLAAGASGATVTVAGKIVTSTEVATGSPRAFGAFDGGVGGADEADGFVAMVVPSSTSVIEGRFLRVVLGSVFPV